MNSVLKSNKGQSLVLFIVFLPIIIMMGTYVIDLSYARYNKNKLDGINKVVTEYGLKHIGEDSKENMIKLISQNDDEIDSYDIKIDSDAKEVYVTLEKHTKGLFGSIVGKDIYKEKSSYKGYIKDDKNIIERVE